MATIKRTKKDESLTIFTVNGVLTCEEVIIALKSYKQDITPNQLWDFADADVSGLTREDLIRIIAFAKSYTHLRENGKTALLGPKDLSYGISRMYEILSEIEDQLIPQCPFRSMDKALAWLESDEQDCT